MAPTPARRRGRGGRPRTAPGPRRAARWPTARASAGRRLSRARARAPAGGARRRHCAGVIAAQLVGVGERVERLERLQVQLLALDQRPLLERRAVGQAEAGRKSPPYSSTASATRRARHAAQRLRRSMCVGDGRGPRQQRAEGEHIQRVVARRHRTATCGDGSEKRHRRPRPARGAGRPARRAGCCGRPPRGYRATAGRAAYRGCGLALLDGQVRQQREMLARAKCESRAVGARDPWRAEQRQARVKATWVTNSHL